MKQAKPVIKVAKLRYFAIVKHWRKLRPLFQSPEAERIWRLNLWDFSRQKATDHKFKYKHVASHYQTPSDHDSCDWRCGIAHRHPEFWKYVCHSACHWVVDLCLHVAMKAYPETPWRIITQRHHSTVWNGSTTDPVLFDINFLALGIEAKEAWEIASRGRFLKPGHPLRPYVFDKGYFRQSCPRPRNARRSNRQQPAQRQLRK